MKTPDENQITRWLDGELDAAEQAAFESRLAAEPELRAELDSLRKVSAAIRQHIPAERELPHADFFNSQIQVRIAQEEMDARKSAERPGGGGIFRWLGMRWLVPAAAAVLAVLGFVLMQPKTEPASDTQVLSSYVPNPQVQARSFHSDEANAAVVMLEGLPPIPPDKTIAGYQVHRSETDAAVAATTLFSEDGEVLLVLAKDSLDQPQILSRSPRG